MISMLSAINNVRKVPKLIKPKEHRNREYLVAKTKPRLARLDKIKGLLTCGNKLTIVDIVRITGITRSTISKDMALLVYQGFAKSLPSSDNLNKHDNSTKLYSLA